MDLFWKIWITLFYINFILMFVGVLLVLKGKNERGITFISFFPVQLIGTVLIINILGIWI